VVEAVSLRQSDQTTRQLQQLSSIERSGVSGEGSNKCNLTIADGLIHEHCVPASVGRSEGSRSPRLIRVTVAGEVIRATKSNCWPIGQLPGCARG
jgi:hypothetical protein